MTKPKVVRMRALGGKDVSICEGCLGCEATPPGDDCAEGHYDDTGCYVRTDYIFIRNTPRALAEYAALVLEHGVKPDMQVKP